MPADIGVTVPPRTALDSQEYGFQILAVMRPYDPHTNDVLHLVGDIVLGRGIEPCNLSARYRTDDGRAVRFTFVWDIFVPKLAAKIETDLNERMVARFPAMADFPVSLRQLRPDMAFDAPTQLVFTDKKGSDQHEYNP